MLSQPAPSVMVTVYIPGHRAVAVSFVETEGVQSTVYGPPSPPDGDSMISPSQLPQVAWVTVALPSISSGSFMITCCVKIQPRESII